nr:unnamed protein product [Callosobruchus analis]
MVFTNDEKNILWECLLTCVASSCGLTIKKTGKLTYMPAKKYNKELLASSWGENMIAGRVLLTLPKELYLNLNSYFYLLTGMRPFRLFQCNLKNTAVKIYLDRRVVT